MIKRGKHFIKSFMTLDYEFTGIRIQEGYLSPVDWTIKIDLIAPEKKGRTPEESEYNASVAFQKIYFWLDTNLPSITIVDVEKEDDLYIANLSSNIMMYCPGSANDDMIVQLLHSKLTALAGTELLIAQIHMKASDSIINYTFDCDDGKYNLPLLTSEYFIEGSARDKTPWWSRDDGFCFEFIRPADSDITDEELFKDIVDPMDEFERVMAEATETQISMVREPARIVQVEKWKPRKVE